MDEPIILVPVQPPPSYILDLFPSKPASGFDHYSKLATLLSSPTSYITLSPPIPLPSSIFDSPSMIPEIKGSIPCVDFPCKVAYISLHTTTKFELSSAYECFLQSHPNRYVPAHIKETWRARFWRNMDMVQWAVNPDILSAIEPGTGYCDLAHCFVPRGCGGGPQVVTMDGKFELAAGVLEVLTTVEAKIKRLFAPALDEKRDIWQIPYRVEQCKKSQFRIREEFRLDEGIFEHPGGRSTMYIGGLVDPKLVERSVGIEPMLTTKRRKRARATSNTQYRPTKLKIIENETGGKAAVRKPQLSMLRLCQTIEGQAYIGVHQQPPTTRQVPPPPPPPPLLSPSLSPQSPSPQPLHLQILHLEPELEPPSPLRLPQPLSQIPQLEPEPLSPLLPSVLQPLPQPFQQPFQPESYPTPPADLSLPPIRPVLQLLNIANQKNCRPSASFELPSPILSTGEEGNECDYRDKAIAE